jgi:hypothetical protein
MRILSPLKNPSPWPGSNLRSLDPVASTLTTTPARRQGPGDVILSAVVFLERSETISKRVPIRRKKEKETPWTHPRFCEWDEEDSSQQHGAVTIAPGDVCFHPYSKQAPIIRSLTVQDHRIFKHNYQDHKEEF